MTAPVDPTGGGPWADSAGSPPTETALPKARRTRMPAVLIAVLVAVFLLSIVRIVTDSNELTSSGTFGAALILAVPILLAGLGGLWAERCGIVNIGLEGMMILGTWFGAWGAFEFGPWWGVAIGILGGAVGGLLHAIATVTFGVDHIVSGVAINILGGGVARFLSVIAYEGVSGGGATQSPRVRGDVGRLDVPFLAGGDVFGWHSPDLFGWLQRQRWFLISDIGGLLRGLTGGLHVLTLLAIAVVPLTWWVLWRTPFGLRLRSVGENPFAADSLGVPVYRMKYIGTVISGGLAGFGGAYLVLVSTGIYREGQTNGRGFIGLAALIFGNWRPGGVGLGSGLFGFATAVQLRSNAAVHGLLLFVALAALVFAARAIWRRRAVPAVLLVLTGLAFWAWYATSETVPTQIISFTPHVTTLLVLALAAQRLRPPAAEGRPWRKGQTE